MNKQMLALIGVVVAGGGLIGWMSGSGQSGQAASDAVAEKAALPPEAPSGSGGFGTAGGAAAVRSATPPPLTAPDPSQQQIEQRARGVLGAEAARVDAALAEQAHADAPAATAAPAPTAGPAMSAAPNAPAPGGWGGQGGPQPGGWNTPG